MILGNLAAVATAVGVALVAVQLWYARSQARTALEDDLNCEYRAIVRNLPLEAFYDDENVVPGSSDKQQLTIYLRYCDLSNQQVYLRSQRRISQCTWELWRDGMKDNLEARSGPCKWAWEDISTRMWRSFDELWSVTQNWALDPADWAPRWWNASARLRRQRQGSRPDPRLRRTH